jgi:hypothetical protein
VGAVQDGPRRVWPPRNWRHDGATSQLREAGEVGGAAGIGLQRLVRQKITPYHSSDALGIIARSRYFQEPLRIQQPSVANGELFGDE